jgi:hypothetical protein
MTGCRRLWEVEAAHDGRLSGTALAAFEQHVGHCKTCAEERLALGNLSRALARDASSEDEVALRRGREELLQAAHQRALRGDGRRAARWIAVAAIAGVLGVVGVKELRAYRDRAVPFASVVASPGARWDRHVTRTLEQVNLGEGVLHLTVRRSSSDSRRVSVHVPDGDIDDLGTIFRVTVLDGRTRELVVSEGTIVFRRAGRAPLLLASPAHWTPATEISPPPSPLPPAQSEESAPLPSASAGATTRKSAPIAHHPDARPSAPPADEDLAYLRIVALRREGRSEEARVAGVEYLRSFPDGFRRTEVLTFVRSGH